MLSPLVGEVGLRARDPTLEKKKDDFLLMGCRQAVMLIEIKTFGACRQSLRGPSYFLMN